MEVAGGQAERVRYPATQATFRKIVGEHSSVEQGLEAIQKRALVKACRIRR